MRRIETNCNRQVYEENAENLFQYISEFLTNIKDVAVSAGVLPGYGIGWTEACDDSLFYNDEEERTGRRCDVHQVFGYRINNSWAIATGITNHPVLSEVASGERKYFREHIFYNNGTLTPAKIQNKTGTGVNGKGTAIGRVARTSYLGDAYINNY